VTSGLRESNSINFSIKTYKAFEHLEKLTTISGTHLVIKVPGEGPVFVDKKMVGTGPKLIFPIKPGKYEVAAVIKGEMKMKIIEFPSDKVVDFSEKK